MMLGLELQNPYNPCFLKDWLARAPNLETYNYIVIRWTFKNSAFLKWSQMHICGYQHNPDLATLVKLC